MTTSRLQWPAIITRAAAIVESYDIPVTLRQLFYRLVMEQLIPNEEGPYKRLSGLTSDLRRKGEFPRLFDRGRRILEPPAFADVADGLNALLQQYRLDRTIGQASQIFIGVEKNALAGLLEAWFENYGLPVLPLGGFSSEDIDRRVKDRVHADGRPAVLIIAGDFDASGMDITRNFIQQTNCWKDVHRIALDEELIDSLGLPVLEGKATDSRAARFIAEHPDIHERHDFGYAAVRGKRVRVPVQVELDAVEPNTLRSLYLDAVNQYWDTSAFERIVASEQGDLDHLAEILAGAR